jgi:hypothetical protein
MDYFRQSKKRFLLVDSNDIILNHIYYSDSQLDIDGLRRNEVIVDYISLLTNELLPEQKEVLDMRLKQNLSFKQIALIQDAKLILYSVVIDTRFII